MTANRVKFDRESELNSAFESSAVFNYFSRLKQELSLAQVNPRKNLTEISSRLARSRRDWRDKRDLAKTFARFCEISVRSRRT